MYLDYFGLRTDPFKLDPNLDFVYVSKSHEETLAHLVYGIEQGEDFVLITGKIGTGKTLALHFLLDQIVSSFKTAFVNVTTVSFLELLKLVLDDLEVPFEKNWDRADLIGALKQFLLKIRKQREKVLIVVDEAQNLDADTLEGLRLLSNLSQPGDQVLQIILVGQPGLQKLIDTPQLEQLRQRIRVNYQLEELSRHEVEEYVSHRMKVSGCSHSVFENKALDRIFRFSRGVPRLVNQFAGRALLAAFVDESKQVRAEYVEEEEMESAGEPAPIPQEEVPAFVPTRVLKKTPKAKSSPGMTREALNSIEDVDLDEIREAREPKMARRQPREKAEKKQKRGLGWVWAAVIVVAIVGSAYIFGGWTWAQSQWSVFQESRASAPMTATMDRATDPVVEDPSLHTVVEKKPVLVDPTPENMTEPEKEAVTTPVKDRMTAQDHQVAAGNGPEIEPEAMPTVPEERPASVIPKVLHVASFRSPGQAQGLISKLQDQEVEGFVQEQSVNGTVWYRVYLGPFPDESTASRVGQDLKDQKVVMYYRLLDMGTEGS